MNDAFQIPVTYNPSGFGSAWAVIASQENPSAEEKWRTRERYFGDVAPVWRFNLESSTWADFSGKAWPLLQQEWKGEWHLLYVSAMYGREFVDSHRMTYSSWDPTLAELTIPHQYFTTQKRITGHISQSTASKVIERSSRAGAKLFDDKEKAFVILDRAKHLLSKQQVRDARELLQRGATSYPEDEPGVEGTWGSDLGVVRAYGRGAEAEQARVNHWCLRSSFP